MVSIEEFSHLVSGIYAAAIAPQRWESTMRDIYRAMGGTFGALVLADEAVWSILDSTLPDAAVADYAAHYRHLDHVLAAVGRGPVGAVRTGSELVAPHRDSEFYTGWLRPNRIGDGLLVRLARGPTARCVIIGSPLRTESFDTAERVQVMSGLVPHFQQALRAQSKLTASYDSDLLLAGTLEAFRHAVMIVAADGQVTNLNSAAQRLLREGDGLGVESGCLCASNTISHRQLGIAIHAAITGGGSAIRGGHAFPLSRPSGKRAYVVHVLPAHRDEDAPAEQPMALVIVIDPDDSLEPAAEVLQRVYRLTDTEAKVALCAMQGLDPKHMADELSVSLTTVRTHLQHVYDKTDTHRQAALVRLLSAVSR